MDDRTDGAGALLRSTVEGTVAQGAMVVAGHFVAAVARMFGPLGVLISLIVGVTYAGRALRSYGDAARGGAIAGGTCAFVGIAVSYLLGDVTAVILLFGTLSSAVAGALGGLARHRLATRRRQTA